MFSGGTGSVSPLVEIDVEYITETDDAIMVTDSVREVWIPKSFLIDFWHENLKNGDCITIEIPEWMAQEKELI